jgi:hypothetical protein
MHILTIIFTSNTTLFIFFKCNGASKMLIIHNFQSRYYSVKLFYIMAIGSSKTLAMTYNTTQRHKAKITVLMCITLDLTSPKHLRQKINQLNNRPAFSQSRNFARSELKQSKDSHCSVIYHHTRYDLCRHAMRIC